MNQNRIDLENWPRYPALAETRLKQRSILSRQLPYSTQVTYFGSVKNMVWCKGLIMNMVMVLSAAIQEISQVHGEISGLTCTLINVQIVWSPIQAQSPFRLGHVRLLKLAIIHKHLR